MRRAWAKALVEETLKMSKGNKIISAKEEIEIFDGARGVKMMKRPGDGDISSSIELVEVVATEQLCLEQ